MTSQQLFQTISFPEELSQECKDFLLMCLDEVPSGRATVESMKGHEWLSEVRSLTSDVLAILTGFLQEHVPYENYNFDPEKYRSSASFVEVCPSMKIISDKEIEDFEKLSDLSLPYVVLEKIMQDICMNDEFDEDKKESLTCLVEETTKSLQLSEMEVDMKPSAFTFTDLEKSLNEQTSKIASLQEQVDQANERNKTLTHELEKIEGFLMGTKKGVEMLAQVLYGKLLPQKIIGDKQGSLNCLELKDDKNDKKKDKAHIEKHWKTYWVILKQTFIFIFKSHDDPTLVDTILFNPLHVELVPDQRYNKKFCFSVEGHIFSANDASDFDDWSKSAQTALSWHAVTL